MMGAHSPFPSPYHDHARCVDRALSGAAEICFQNGERMTANRKAVYLQVLSSHKAQNAAEIADGLARDGKRSVSPMMVYRALDFLVEQGLIHKISSLNAYIGCAEPMTARAHCFLICTVCGVVTDYHDEAVVQQLTKHIRAIGFNPKSPVVEVPGICPFCQDSEC